MQSPENQRVAVVAVPIQKAEIHKNIEVYQGKQAEAGKNPPNEKALKATDQNRVINNPESSTQGAVKRDMAKASQTNTPLIVETTFGSRNAPAFIHRETPLYPPVARRLGKEGKVVLKLMIDSNGRLREIEVLEDAAYGFTEAAVEAVKRSTYAPALQNGVKAAARAILPIRFHLE